MAKIILMGNKALASQNSYIIALALPIINAYNVRFLTGVQN